MDLDWLLVLVFRRRSLSLVYGIVIAQDTRIGLFYREFKITCYLDLYLVTSCI